MKITKNVLMMSLTLTIALCTSTQITPMERRINPYLDEKAQKEILENIRIWKNQADPHYKYRGSPSPQYGAQASAIAAVYEEVYYGDRPYTEDEIEIMKRNARDHVAAQFGHRPSDLPQ